MKTLSSSVVCACVVILFALLSQTSKAIIRSSNTQADILDELIQSKKINNNDNNLHSWKEEDVVVSSKQKQYFDQKGSMEKDKISALPGQPYYGVNFDQYSGYVTVDPTAGKALFYYFVESPFNPSTKPLVLWLNGGPGCSSFGYGAMEELGPFRVNSDGKTLFRNKYAWNNVANVLFLESPAGVGFSYSNTSSDYDHTGDKSTANDAYIFLLNWLERFPQYKSRDFLIAGESYSGHYVPQLAYTILVNNQLANRTIINLKGITIGNAWIDDATSEEGIYDYFWTHALNSDETHDAVVKNCDFSSQNVSVECHSATSKALSEKGEVDFYNIYAPLCHDDSLKNTSTPPSIFNFDPCSDNYVEAYLNNPEVQLALHAIPTNYSLCTPFFNWTDSPSTIIPIIKYLFENGIRVWIYSGDTDARVPVTSSRYSINLFNLPIEVPWRTWYSGNEVGGYVVKYEGITFVTIRGAGHTVPSWQPARALTFFTSFIKKSLPPSSPWPKP